MNLDLNDKVRMVPVYKKGKMTWRLPKKNEKGFEVKLSTVAKCNYGL